MGLRAATLPRQPKNLGIVDTRGYAEDDGYVDALRKNVYNQGIGEQRPFASAFCGSSVACKRGEWLELMTSIHSPSSSLSFTLGESEYVFAFYAFF
jgi:hypothetical protein